MLDNPCEHDLIRFPIRYCYKRIESYKCKIQIRINKKVNLNFYLVHYSSPGILNFRLFSCLLYFGDGQIIYIHIFFLKWKFIVALIPQRMMGKVNSP